MHQPNLRVLIVDDQVSIRRTMTVIVENWGCQAVDVEDGYHAIDFVKNDNFDLVFLDIKMPGINGVQTYREIKKIRPDSLVVVMTGFDVRELIDSAIDEGVLAVVLKPFEPKQIVEVLRAVHGFCPERLPTQIAALTTNIKQQLQDLIGDSPLARIAVRVPDSGLKALRLLAVSGPASENTPPLRSLASLAGSAFYNEQVQVINDFQIHPLARESDVALGARSVLAVPIRSGADRILGSVSASCYEAGYFDQDVVGKFLGLARLIGDLMESASPVEAQLLHGMGRVGIPAT